VRTRVTAAPKAVWAAMSYADPGASILLFGKCRPLDFGPGGRGGRRGSWTGREILLYLIM